MMSDEIITLTGLRKLRVMQRRKEQLPENWRELATAYIKTKKRMVFLHREHGPYKMLEMDMEQLAEAKRITKLMGVKS
jgi:hypothetical protein